MTTRHQPHPVSQRSVDLLITAALLAITLGIALQGGLILLRLSTGLTAPALRMTADALSGIAWSTVVCAGIAVGIGATRYRGPIMGLLGLVCAPLAFALAKGVQKGVSVLAGKPGAPIDSLVLQIGVVKTMEYALLGILVAWLVETGRSTLARHALTGLVFGLVFGGWILGLEHTAAPVPPTRLVGLVLNEVLFPVGCSVVLYLVNRLATAGGRS
jgi:hypothetical protein